MNTSGEGGIKVNFYVEDMLFFKYIGCATVAKTLYRELSTMDNLQLELEGSSGQR